MKKTVITLLNVAVIAAVLLVWQGRQYLSRPVGGYQPVSMEVKVGDTLRPALNRLERMNFLPHSDWLYLYARLTGVSALKTGGYQFVPTQTPLEILTSLQKGSVVTETLTLIEGRNRWDMRHSLAKAGWIEAEVFDELCDSEDFLRANSIPGPSCEGYLFPDTYVFARGVSARPLFETFFQAYRRAYTALTESGKGPMSLSEREFITLASIVEKETGAAKERPRIACVFYNRLKARPAWRLQTAPTVIYAATLENPQFDGNIKRSHLRKMDNPYNTYLRHGLPPGPIASPGKLAMQAVRSPSECKDFFFVSKNNGEHVFCPTLACHNKAVKKWQVDYFRRRKGR